MQLLITVAWLVAEQGLEATQASVIVARALSCPAACGILPDQGLSPCPPAWADKLLTTGLPGNSSVLFFFKLKGKRNSLKNPRGRARSRTLFTGPPLGFLSACSHPAGVAFLPASQPQPPVCSLQENLQIDSSFCLTFGAKAKIAWGENGDAPLTQMGTFLRRLVSQK